MTKLKVAVVMGAESDLPVVQKAIEKLDELEVPRAVRVLSAHRTPVVMKRSRQVASFST